MSGRIPRSFIDDLLVRVDIVDLVDSHLPLKKSGSNYVARCPFHTEKTPSFSVNRAKQMFHCFGCGASGNAISFLMDYSHLGFIEAVEDLAAFVGVEVPKDMADTADVKSGQNLTRLYDVLEAVAAFYIEQLRRPEGKPAVDYLKSRGVTGEIARDYGLGYAPSHRKALAQFDQNALVDAGVLVRRDDGQVYDRFYGRLIFPIRDKRKRVIGFGGRVLDNSLPKYLNSPETPIFSKGKELYGVCELLARNNKPTHILVVEGYMDVLALTQFGITNAVAALGTAASKAHMDLLFRFTSELVFCFDGDNAGRQAAWKATEAALPCLRDGRQIKIMLLPQGQDPDTLVREEGVDAFKLRIETASVLSDYFFEQVVGHLNLATVEGRAQLLSTAKPQLEKMPKGFFRDMMFGRMRELSGARIVDSGQVIDVQSGKRQRQAQKSTTVRTLLSLLLQYPQLSVYLEAHLEDLRELDFAGLDLLENIRQQIAAKRPENSAILLECYRGTVHEKTINALLNLVLNIPEGGEERFFCDALMQLSKQARDSRMTGIIQKLSRGEVLTLAETEELRVGGRLRANALKRKD